MRSSSDIILPRHGEAPQKPSLPPDIRLVSVAGNVIIVRWGLRGWSQVPAHEQESIRKQYGIE